MCYILRCNGTTSLDRITHSFNHSTQGIDYPNVTVVIQYGMCPSLCSLIQRAGRAARAPGTEALFIYMVENWVKGEHIDKQLTAYVKDPDTPVHPVGKGKKDKQWVGMASVAFANSMSCLRVELMEYLGDKSGDHGTNTSVPFI